MTRTLSFAGLFAGLFLVLPAFAFAAAPVRFSGQLIELSSTDLPATVVVRENPQGTWTDHVVTIPAGASLSDAMDGWITGDGLAVSGTQDEATGVVTASSVQDVSLDASTVRAANGWVKSIDAAASTMTVTWNGTDTVVSVTPSTHLVVPPANPAALSDFQIGDRVRLRLARETDQASIIVALRRGSRIFLMARTRPFKGTVVGTDAGRRLLDVRLAADPSLRYDDVNNLVGVADEIVSVTYDANARFTTASGGAGSPGDVGVGDDVEIVGRVGDDGIIAARAVKDANPVGGGGAPFAGYTGTVTGAVPAGRLFNVKLDGGATWTVEYTSATKAYRGAQPADMSDVAVGDRVVVHGWENRQMYTISTQDIAILPPPARPASAAHPLARVRPLADMIRERIEAGLGRMSERDFIKNQAPATAEQPDETAA